MPTSRSKAVKPPPPLTDYQRLGRACVAVSEAIDRLAESLWSDLPDAADYDALPELAEEIETIQVAALGLLANGRRLELGLPRGGEERS